MASLVLNGDTSGSITLSSPAVAGSTTQTLVAATGTLAPLISGTAQASTSGTSIDFTGIPSWVKRITVMFSGVSTSGTSNIQVQLGTSGGVETSGYSGMASSQNGTVVNNSAGLLISSSITAASVVNGAMFVSIQTGNTFVCSGSVSIVSGGYWFAGSKSLSGTLDRVRITTVNGTDTFDAGTINILYE